MPLLSENSHKSITESIKILTLAWRDRSSGWLSWPPLSGLPSAPAPRSWPSPRWTWPASSFPRRSRWSAPCPSAVPDGSQRGPKVDQGLGTEKWRKSILWLNLMNLLRGAFLSRMLCSAALKEFRGATEERIERRTTRCLILEQDGTHTIRHSSALFRLFRVKSQSIFLLTILPRPLKRKVGVPKFNLYNFRITFAFKLPYCWVLASTSRWSFWMHWRLIIDKLRFPPLQESHLT